MDQFEIEDKLDVLLAKADTDIEKVFAKRLKSLLASIAEMYRKYEKNGVLGYTELNKYNRFQKEIDRYAKVLTEDYRALIKEMEELQETQYVMKFLLTAYLLDQVVADPEPPPAETIEISLLDIIASLKLPKPSEEKVKRTSRRIRKEFIKGAGLNEPAEKIAKRLEKHLDFAPGVEIDLSEKLTVAIFKKSEPAINPIGFDIPSVETVKTVLENPVKELRLLQVLEQHRNDTVRRINIELAQGIQAGESYSTIGRRLEKELGFASAKARTVARTEAGRARSIANEKVYERASEYTDTTKVWASALDGRVRSAHRSLDKKEADSNGVFTHGANFATGPRLFVGPDAARLNINCRCTVIVKVDGKLPEYRRARDYMDDKYQEKLTDRIDKFMGDNGLTYKQAVEKAQKEVKPPSRLIPYVSYEEWLEEMGERN